MSDVVKTFPLLLQVMPTELTALINGEVCRLWQGVDENGGEYVLWVRAVQPQNDTAERALDMTLNPDEFVVVTQIWRGGKPDKGGAK